MVDPERLAAFALMTGATSLMPGVSMLFVMGQTVRAGWRTGAAALAGMQLGYIGWWLLAALGLGTLANAWPRAFLALAVAGSVYLAWLGAQAIRHAGEGATAPETAAPRATRHALRDGVMVALGNPKSLVYMVAMLPPFIDTRAAVPPQIVVLALVALVIDVAIGALYIGAGHRLTAALARPATRRAADRVIGGLFIAIALGVLIDLWLR